MLLMSEAFERKASFSGQISSIYFFYNCEYKLTDRYTDSLFLILLPRYGLNSKYILVCFYFVLSNCFSFIYV